MSSCVMSNRDSDEEVDLEALRLAALKSRKNRYGPRVNHRNLIPIVPIAIETSELVEAKIKKEKLSPTSQCTVTDDGKDGINKENEEDRKSTFSETNLDINQDFLNVDDKEEEDSLEKLMDQLEAEISGKEPLSSNRIVLSSKNSNSDKKDKKKLDKGLIKEIDDEVELVQIKSGKEPGAVIEIRESASPELRESDGKKSELSPHRRSSRPRSLKSRSKSPFGRERSYRRSRSPYWSKSPRRSRSPLRRSRSPFWVSRCSRSSSIKSRSPYRRYRSPGRKRSPLSRFSRSRSRSFERRRSPWSMSPRRRSKSPFYKEGSPFRRKNFYSPSGRRSYSPRRDSNSPRRRSRSPRRFVRNSPFHRSKSPFKRSRSPFKRNKSPLLRSGTPGLRPSKSPVSKSNSPSSKRPTGRHSRTPPRWSMSPGRRAKTPDRSSVKHRSKSPIKNNEQSKSAKYTGSKDDRSCGFTTSPASLRNRSPIRTNRLDTKDKNDRSRYRDRYRDTRRHRSLSRENNRSSDRRGYKPRQVRRHSPFKHRKTPDRFPRKSRSPKIKDTAEETKEGGLNETVKDAGTSPVPDVPPDPILEARKKKFESLSEVDPTIDKKISLKSVKESTENNEEDDDALTINIETNLWDDSEESGDECESRFKSGDSKKNRSSGSSRTLSFLNLREGGSTNRKIILNKPLIEENPRDRFNRSEKHDRWQGRRSDRSNLRRRGHFDGSKNRSEGKSDKISVQSPNYRRSDRRPIVWSNKDEEKSKTNVKDHEVSTTQSEIKKDKGKGSDRKLSENKGKSGKEESDDFDKLISDFEKELESDICFTTKGVNSPGNLDQGDRKKSRAFMKDIYDIKSNVESTVRKGSGARTVKISEASSNRLDKNFEETEENQKVCVNSEQLDGPEDYIEDDDFVIETSVRTRPTNKVDEEDSQSDLRTVLSRRRNERLTKVVTLPENVPTRLVQSAFQGLGSKNRKRQNREVTDPVTLSIDRGLRNSGVEKRRVLLLQREKNLSLSSSKNNVPEAQPDTTVYQRFPRSSERKKLKLAGQLDPIEDLMEQEEEEEGFDMEEHKQSRRFRLKRNITLSSQ